MATTPNYGWVTPAPTDFVTDLPADFEVFADAVDASFAADEGDLLVGGTSNIFEALPIGAAGTVLTSDGDTAEWAAPAGGGKIVQVVNATQSSQQNITSTSLIDTNITATITPLSATNKILILINFSGLIDGSGAQVRAGGALLRASTNIQTYGANSFGDLFTATLTTAKHLRTLISICHLDSPATISATTYKVQAITDSGTTFFINNGCPASIILLEVEA